MVRSHCGGWVMDRTLQEPTDARLGPCAPQMESHESLLLFTAPRIKEEVQPEESARVPARLSGRIRLVEH